LRYTRYIRSIPLLLLTCRRLLILFFLSSETATTEIYTLSLHDALPIWAEREAGIHGSGRIKPLAPGKGRNNRRGSRSVHRTRCGSLFYGGKFGFGGGGSSLKARRFSGTDGSGGLKPLCDR